MVGKIELKRKRVMPGRLMGISSMIVLGGLLGAIVSSPIENQSHFDSHPEQVSLLIIGEPTNELETKQLHNFNHPHTFLVKKEEDGFQFIHSIQSLKPFDHDNDNIIDQSDPIFGKLYLGLYHPKLHRFSYQPLNNTAIRALKLLTKKGHVYAAQAILANHSQNSQFVKIMISEHWFKSSHS